MKKALLFLVLILIPLVSAITPPPQDYPIHNGRVENSEHVTITVYKGWNILPLKFIMEASGRYWANHKEGQTCDQDIFRNVHYYSPAAREYYHIPVIDDWGAPLSRDNNFLLNEFRAKYYHIYAGSAWIYSPSRCILEGDSGVSLISDSYSNQGYGYTKDELILKAGWNFIPLNLRMYVFERNMYELLQECSPSRFFGWHSRLQEWEDLTDEIREIQSTEEYDTPRTTNIFETIVVKTDRDCYFADFDESSGSSPPPLPD